MNFKQLNRLELLAANHARLDLILFCLGPSWLLHNHVLLSVSSLELVLCEFLVSHKVRITHRGLLIVVFLVIAVVDVISIQLVILQFFEVVRFEFAEITLVEFIRLLHWPINLITI